ncbi:bacteriohemerythrin [Ethanoligenens harbinense]|uniref:Hemerythrin-like metal-binding protein n=2 Tax=Ethanoligenens harbinense TaxID=253239 RepID=E6U7K3_ETHHY|nr:bacteriohemerythrin [Ethanoligenens harbinense]ACO91806.1 hemerythrin-like metal-binding protein [Ethanoligenens harbinense YUAN-3]ADU27026.1 hemerythrin-like metal-binding protein [Ethanoligenens harbinense YUAN-3]AVQ96113.1 hemerythrin [Ethanoligenens harbinense YUAN-3]AYF38774.1 hemerythrin [Ethanoligenens harbinense]AYF41522.1 hemerythrin [Ethanoligenens harbinense]
MEWKDELSVGVELIDNEHKELIRAVNELFDACMHGKGRAKIAETLKFVENYTVKHFGDEEALQKKYNYPGFPAHQKLHKAFVSDLQNYKRQLETEGPTVNLVATFNTFVSSWLIKHISIEDKKIGIHIRSLNQ